MKPVVEKRYRVGLDVGGTNTDAVLMSGSEVISWVKTRTSRNVDEGIVAALTELLEDTAVSHSSIEAVMIGTTHFTNALVERSHLSRVAAIRICLPANTSIPVAGGWPHDMLDAVQLAPYLIHGGSNFNGQPISDVDLSEVVSIAESIKAKGISNIALCAPFSPVSPEAELQVAKLLHELIPVASISLSHEIGRLGLLERESATIINAALTDLAGRTFSRFRSALSLAEIHAPLFISQNDGTVMSAEYATKYPVRTLASGPTNSMRGAAFLSGLDDAVVVDVGGTTADAGTLVRGFPREAAAELNVEGIRTNFRMPDVLSVGIGGGSLITKGPEDGVTVGPRSVGYEISSKALIFGGTEVTATDVAVAAGIAAVGDASKVAGLDKDFVQSSVEDWHERIDSLIAVVRGSAEPLPVILVGGGSLIVDPYRLREPSHCVVPDYFQVANAVGAAIPQVSGEIDRVVALGVDREATVETCRQAAISTAIAAGADPASIQIVEEDVITLNYLTESAARIRIRAVGAVPMDAYADLRVAP
ncbi:hydantoinase/oxoprolinase family protein [Paenarthrobacter sp. NPDC089322]|uniref:hydantoinase/oxoprolinase family protein n=1 Tax=Paenarthrobacter sp. NPDC089322 TaxID=3155065 RepID=UPI00341E24A3